MSNIHVTSDDGRPGERTASMNDVTERMSLESALPNESLRLETAFDGTPEDLSLYSPQSQPNGTSVEILPTDNTVPYASEPKIVNINDWSKFDKQLLKLFCIMVLGIIIICTLVFLYYFY
jgi:hypothetical protein